MIFEEFGNVADNIQAIVNSEILRGIIQLRRLLVVGTAEFTVNIGMGKDSSVPSSYDESRTKRWKIGQNIGGKHRNHSLKSKIQMREFSTNSSIVTRWNLDIYNYQRASCSRTLLLSATISGKWVSAPRKERHDFRTPRAQWAGYQSSRRYGSRNIVTGQYNL